MTEISQGKWLGSLKGMPVPTNILLRLSVTRNVYSFSEYSILPIYFSRNSNVCWGAIAPRARPGSAPETAHAILTKLEQQTRQM